MQKNLTEAVLVCERSLKNQPYDCYLFRDAIEKIINIKDLSVLKYKELFFKDDKVHQILRDRDIYFLETQYSLIPFKKAPKDYIRAQNIRYKILKKLYLQLKKEINNL